jgi:hypothetical protein
MPQIVEYSLSNVSSVRLLNLENIDVFANLLIPVTKTNLIYSSDAFKTL